jgi:endonuclease/exonuclease/phosphatase family metal-dependent hydrolase
VAGPLIVRMPAARADRRSVRWEPFAAGAGSEGASAARVATLLLVASLVLGSACASAPAPAADPPGASVRVLVYNIHAGKDGAGVHNLARVAALIAEHRADVVLLQEVDRGTRRSGGEDQLATLMRSTGMHGAMGKTLDYDGGEYGIALLSRWPIEGDTLIRLPVTPEQTRSGGSREPRGAQVVRVRHPGGPLVLINTHLDASRDDLWRRQEAGHLMTLARSLDAGGASVLVGGDINSTPESEVQALIRGAGLVDAWTLCGSGDGFTFRADSLVKRIDYLYLMGGASCSSARVLATLASDHRPLLVEVELPGAKARSSRR